MKIGILGGTFNPVHNGHLLVAEGARPALGLDQVLWIPAKLPPHKPVEGHVSPEDRCRMVELAIAGRPEWALSRIELERPGPSYTVDTLRQLTRERPGTTWYCLIGSDIVPELPTWRAIEEAMALATFVAVPRPPADSLRKSKPRGLSPALTWLEIPTMDISSSEIRRRLRAGQHPALNRAPVRPSGQSVDDLVPPAVAHYIRTHHLYTA